MHTYSEARTSYPNGLDDRLVLGLLEITSFLCFYIPVHGSQMQPDITALVPVAKGMAETPVLLCACHHQVLHIRICPSSETVRASYQCSDNVLLPLGLMVSSSYTKSLQNPHIRSHCNSDDNEEAKNGAYCFYRVKYSLFASYQTLQCYH